MGFALLQHDRTAVDVRQVVRDLDASQRSQSRFRHVHRPDARCITRLDTDPVPEAQCEGN